MENNIYYPFHCTKNFVMRSGAIGFIKGKTYQGMIHKRKIDHYSFKSELTSPWNHHNLPRNLVLKYFSNFKYGK